MPATNKQNEQKKTIEAIYKSGCIKGVIYSIDIEDKKSHKHKEYSFIIERQDNICDIKKHEISNYEAVLSRIKDYLYIDEDDAE